MPSLNWLGKDKVVAHDLDVPYHRLKRVYIFNAEDVNFQRFPTLDAKKLVNAPKMSAHHRGICHF